MLTLMKDWKALRISLLAVTLGGVLLVMGKILLYPTHVERKFTPFEFPASVPLPEWQMLESVPLTIPEGSPIKAAKRYLYQQDNLAMNIEMRYLIDMDGKIIEFGKLEEWMKEYSALQSPPDRLSVTSTEGVGFYGLAESQGRGYLSACINSQGGTTATSDQFMKNRNTYDLRFNRILPWLLGQGELRDRRCLWVVMSLPVEKATREKGYKILETAWVSWYRWWQPRFPRP